MIRRTAPTVLAALLLLSGLAACAKKKPQTVPQAAPPPRSEPAPPPATPPPAPAPVPADEVEADPFAGDLASVNDLARRQGLLGDVYFEFDRSDLDPTSRERLAANARFFASHPDLTFTLEGHCDERGTNEYNLALGERRVSAVQQYLVSLQVEAERLKTLSFGEERPFCTTSDESCWHENRRVHFVITGRRTAP